MKTTKEAARAEDGRSHYSELPDTPTKATGKKDSVRRGKENREIRILRRSKTLKEKNDPDRFNGDGVNFRAKIIGTEPVIDARGNRMCQGALQRLKAAVKTSGDHKQKIVINISLKGIIIKDEKSGEMLHHHPIHKISFISQDTGDNRAFGYVFGCPQTGHEFFGIKTEKIASQVVLTLRDLFLAALEIKKKEIAGARRESDEVSSASVNMFVAHHAPHSENGHTRNVVNSEFLYSNTVLLPEENGAHCRKETPASASAVDSLLDLQFTVDSLQQGISHMDHSIASAASQNFGLSFSEDDISECSSSSMPASFPFKRDKLSSLYQETLSISSRSSSTSDYNAVTAELGSQPADLSPTSSSFSEQNGSLHAWSDPNSSAEHKPKKEPTLSEVAKECLAESESSRSLVEDRYAVFQDIDNLPSIFDNPTVVSASNDIDIDIDMLHFSPDREDEPAMTSSEIKTSTPIVFAELDPLGRQPFVDKKDFFQDIKNPPKKVLKDLAGDEIFPIEEQMEAKIASDVEDTDPNVSNPFTTSIEPVAKAPPRLPPKKWTTPSVNPACIVEEQSWEVKNPFNPFEYPDIPPPSSPPPPPPPRLPTTFSDNSMSSPPPRPPNRSLTNVPLPKRRSPFAATNQTWFSFDQESVAQAASSEPDENSNSDAPPLPSPARKFPLPPPTREPPRASSSPLCTKKIENHSEDFATFPELVKADATLPHSSPRKVLSRHASLAQDCDSFPCTFPDLAPPSYYECKKGNIEIVNDSPPLPPKPLPISRPRPSPSKKFLASASRSSAVFGSVDGSSDKTTTALGNSSNPSSDSAPLSKKPPAPDDSHSSDSSKSSVSGTNLAVTENSHRCSNGKHSSSFEQKAPQVSIERSSSSGIAATDTSNGTRSSSSLVFSSSAETRGSSSDALFPRDSVFARENIDSSQELSPDSIFRRKSDPFADDFFLSLPRRSTPDNLDQNGFEAHFEDIKSPS